MATAATTSITETPRPDTLDIHGALVATAELGRSPTTYQPPDQLWLFRGEHGWTLLSVCRTERWSDYGAQELEHCHARAVTEVLTSVDGLADRIRSRYGEPGWRGVLDAGNAHPDLFRAWVPGAIERELETARFFRDDLVASFRRFTSRELDELAADIEEHLRAAHFEVVAVKSPTRPSRAGENPVMAQAVVRRYGYEAVTIVRMDSAGEVYVRFADESDARGRVLREVVDDDD